MVQCPGCTTCFFCVFLFFLVFSFLFFWRPWWHKRQKFSTLKKFEHVIDKESVEEHNPVFWINNSAPLLRLSATFLSQFGIFRKYWNNCKNHCESHNILSFFLRWIKNNWENSYMSSTENLSNNNVLHWESRGRWPGGDYPHHFCRNIAWICKVIESDGQCNCG